MFADGLYSSGKLLFPGVDVLDAVALILEWRTVAAEGRLPTTILALIRAGRRWRWARHPAREFRRGTTARVGRSHGDDLAS